MNKTQKEINKHILTQNNIKPYIDQILEIYGGGCKSKDGKVIYKNLGISLGEILKRWEDTSSYFNDLYKEAANEEKFHKDRNLQMET